jgi:hypothetical protein
VTFLLGPWWIFIGFFSVLFVFGFYAKFVGFFFWFLGDAGFSVKIFKFLKVHRFFDSCDSQNFSKNP